VYYLHPKTPVRPKAPKDSLPEDVDILSRHDGKLCLAKLRWKRELVLNDSTGIGPVF
jgi:hypothetical protein